jgi:4-amino-4-deoxy-L-arabinose transferase-like glycosyltransferase
MIKLMSSTLGWQRPFPHRQRLLLAIIIAAGLSLRLVALGQYITPDELNWVHRSVLFHQALGRGAWAETLTTGHPGVMTTWLGALGIQLQLWIRPSDVAAYDWITHLAWLAPENTAAFPELATFLSAGRTAVAVANTLGLVVIYWLARRLLGIWPALVVAAMLALDPFVAGLSGLLHVDGLMTTFSTIALLALAIALNDGQRVDWRFTAVSGAAAGCAILAKSTALTLLPFAALAFGVALLLWRSRWQRVVGLGLVWLLALIGTQFVLLPALWSHPVGSYQTIIGTIFHETEEVLPLTFFMGNVSQAPGIAFYPVALLFRLNPLVLAGLLLAGWFGWQEGAKQWWQRPSRLIVILWPVFFVLILSLASRKYDRYLLPALPLLFLLAVLGWDKLRQKRPSWARPLTVASALLALVYVGTAVPYLLNAYNPLVGGWLSAKYVMPLGWGESVSAAAHWLADQPDAAEKTVVASVGPAFAPFFPGETILRDGDNWREADFVVETLTGYQDANFGPHHLRNGQTLLHTIRYDGQDQAWIFGVDDPIKPQIDWQPLRSEFGGQIDLLAAGTAVKNDQLDVWLKWQLTQPTNGRFKVQLRLLDENDHLWSQMEMPLLNEIYFYPEHWQLDEQPDWHYPLLLPFGLPPAPYRVEMSLYADESGAQLPVVGANGRFAGVVQTVAALDLVPQPLFQSEPLALTTTPQPLLDGKLLFLEAAALPESVLTASNFTVDLFWQGMAELPANLQLQFWADAVPLATLPLSRFDSGLWQQGQVIHEKYRVPIPIELSEGEKILFSAELVDEHGNSIQAHIPLGTISVTSPDRLFRLPDDVSQPVVLRFGDLISLRGFDLQTGTAVPGNPVQLKLYWQVERQPDEIYSIFVHLVGPDGQIVAQGDQWPGGLPGNTWAAGQIIIDEYAIQLPQDAPLGRYQIVLGVYMPSNGLRLPITPDDGPTLPIDHFVLPLPLEVVR